MNFQALPKVELHLHLDCSLSHAAASRLAPGLSQEAFERAFIAAHFQRCNLDALEAAFAEPAARTRLRAKLLTTNGARA